MLTMPVPPLLLLLGGWAVVCCVWVGVGVVLMLRMRPLLLRLLPLLPGLLMPMLLPVLPVLLPRGLFFCAGPRGRTPVGLANYTACEAVCSTPRLATKGSYLTLSLAVLTRTRSCPPPLLRPAPPFPSPLIPVRLLLLLAMAMMGSRTAAVVVTRVANPVVG